MSRLNCQWRQLDADPREADALAAHFAAGRDIVKARELAALHARAVVHGRQCALRRVHDLGEDGLLERTGIRSPQIFQQVK